MSFLRIPTAVEQRGPRPIEPDARSGEWPGALGGALCASRPNRSTAAAVCQSRRTPTAMILKDAEFAARVIRRMLDAGVPVELIEADRGDCVAGVATERSPQRVHPKVIHWVWPAAR